MKNVKSVLLATAAFSVMAGAAFAGSGNELYLDQTGTNGTVNATQSGSNNKVGTMTGVGRGRQEGSFNNVVIIQSGNNNVGTGGNLGLDQLGSSNDMRLEQTGNHNTVVGMSQFSSGDNDMRIYQTSNYNKVTAAVQDTDGTSTESPSNFMEIVQQSGDGNLISRASQDGADNDMYLRQSGHNNTIALATQGDFNVSSGSAPGNTVNGWMNILQAGNHNVIDRAQQFGTSNSMTLTFSGDYNGASAMASAVAVDVAGGNKAVAEQSGLSNSMSVAISGNDNSFSLIQTGNGGSLTGNVLGGGNELAALQAGTSNSLNFTVDGFDNAFGIEQDGTSNQAFTSQTGNGSSISLMQAGSNNFANISQ